MRGEAAFLLAEAEFVADEVHQVGRVRLVHHGEVGSKFERPAVDTQETVGDGVEGSAPDSTEGFLGGELPGAAEHLARSPAG